MSRARRLVACVLLVMVGLIAMPAQAGADCLPYLPEYFADQSAEVFRAAVSSQTTISRMPLEQRVMLEVEEVVKGDLPGRIEMRFAPNFECIHLPLRVNHVYLIYANGGDLIGYAAEQPSFTAERQLGFLAVLLGFLVLAYNWRSGMRRRSVG